MAVLSSKQRKALPKASFALPSKKAYPIPDKTHAIDALARSSGKPEEASVRRAVLKKYPSLKKK